MTTIIFGKETRKIAKLITKEMPALSFVIWDLTPFILIMHNWRKNIIFLECDRVAVDPLAETLSKEYPNYEIYSGIKKPILKVRRPEKEATIVIVARETKGRRDINETSPMLEMCLVDLLYYSKNGLIPIPLNDILDLWEYYLADTNLVKFNELYRYSLRRYLGWFVSVMAYTLSKKTKLKIDVRHLNQGMKNLELIKMVSA